MGESAWTAAAKTQSSGDKQQSGEPAAGGTGRQVGKKTGGTNPGFGGFSLDGHYAECYPGMAEEYDATYDSDEEADYTKMDMVGVVLCVSMVTKNAHVCV